MTNHISAMAADNSGTTDGTMRAIVQDGYGPVDVLQSGRAALPRIAENEVLIRVHAAGMDRGTWHMMTGRPYLLRVLGIRVPQAEEPGARASTSPARSLRSVPLCTRFAVGDEVYGMSRGAFAEYAAALEDKLAHKPSNLSFEQAAVVPISAGTALQALDAGRVERGQKVLILGASGGVGTYAVQLAKSFGAEVTGVSSAGKIDLVRSLGADHVLDYTQDDFADGTRRYDLILDIGGNPTLSRLRRALTPTGTAVDRRRRGRRQVDRRLRPEPAGTLRVPVRASAPRHARFQGTRQRPRTAHAPPRGRRR